MKNLIYLFLALTIFLGSCGDDDGRDLEFSLSHDGDNDNSPILPEDTYEAASQFSANQMAAFQGQRLTEVGYYMYNAPLSTTLKIYGPGEEANRPGEVLYEGRLTGSITNDAWSIHTLSTPVPITGEELWISIRMQHNRDLQSIGCDRGPAASGGDWLFQESDGVWRSFRQRTGENINWNIRGIVAE